jgi:hypothetical protein
MPVKSVTLLAQTSQCLPPGTGCIASQSSLQGSSIFMVTLRFVVKSFIMPTLIVLNQDAVGSDIP